MAKYIVNHGGVVHSVNDEDLAIHLGTASMKPSDADPAGKPARMATNEEIAGWFTMQGLPVPDEFAPAKADAGSSDESNSGKKASK